MKPLYIGSTSESLWFTHILGIYQNQTRDTGRPREGLMSEYGADKYNQHGGEGHGSQPTRL